ncbi:hypothetical protein N0B51_09220 [Tsuneonella sp. YG55]|uniref:Ferrochelatase n=1 Tax=Tsuneonella litorea TaxID=2976475 RepID=A0A9X2W1T3_9SPHN|nr:hypothetical protein [Tsuneonella litorea]MCT2559162.1 hypothetical protein [Tsuneonella litorea]
MRFDKIASSLAAVSLMVAPVAVQAAPADRASAPAAEESELGGTLVLIFVAIAAIVAAILIIDGDDDPVSP